MKATFAQGGGGEAVNTILRVANDLRDAVLALARQPPRPASRPLGGVGLVESATALHRDCESKKVMCSECVSAMWVVGTPRAHHIVEWGLRAHASELSCFLERPKANVHGTEAGPLQGSWGRTATCCFEAWRE